MVGLVSWIYVALSAIVPITMYAVIFALRIRGDRALARLAAVLLAVTLAPGVIVLAGATHPAGDGGAPDPMFAWINVRLWLLVGTACYVLGLLLLYVIWSVHAARRDATGREGRIATPGTSRTRP